MREPFSYRQASDIPPFDDTFPIVIYDGYCGLCSRLVQFVLRHDRQGRYRFLPAQSALGEALYRHYDLAADDFDTFILLTDGQALKASDAALALLAGLDQPWKLLTALRLLPRSWRDQFYFLVARNRMRFFGRLDTCDIPDPRHSHRFLSGEI